MSYLLSLVAGLLTSLSPCVLPALPLIVGSASAEHRKAPLAVALGMILSFTILGVFFAASGPALGFEPNLVRSIAASMMFGFGLVMISTRLQDLFLKILTPLSNLGNNKLARGKFKGLTGQFNLGALLGVVWSPCVGPTLGAAVGMASQRENLGQAALMMLLFGVGSAVPLLCIAYGSRRIFNTHRNRLLNSGQAAKSMMGAMMMIVGAGILLGLDKIIETQILDLLPSGWIDLISRF
jgi:cytochrome c-type biogenesis protein